LKHDISYVLESKIIFEVLKVIIYILTIQSKQIKFHNIENFDTFYRFPNAYIFYRIILAIHITVAAAVILLAVAK